VNGGLPGIDYLRGPRANAAAERPRDEEPPRDRLSSDVDSTGKDGANEEGA